MRVTSNSHDGNMSLGMSASQDMTKSQIFNKRYSDYVSRVKEVNHAKEMLRINRDKMSFEMKSKFVKHIKRKMAIIEMIEDELKHDANDRDAYIADQRSTKVEHHSHMPQSHQQNSYSIRPNHSMASVSNVNSNANTGTQHTNTLHSGKANIVIS